MKPEYFRFYLEEKRSRKQKIHYTVFIDGKKLMKLNATLIKQKWFSGSDFVSSSEFSGIKLK
jgi:hypothetical protein